jgi:hypothetical protein
MASFLQSIARYLMRVGRWLGELFGLGSGSGAAGVVPVTVTGARPGSGWPGTVLTLDGAGFADTLDGNTVTVGGDAALVIRAAANRLTVLIGERARSGPVRVTTGGVTASAPDPFVILPWPEIRDSASHGAPVFFHGPQGGTPALGKKNQPILVVFAEGAGGPAVDVAAEIAAEMATFHDAERFWREATYASVGAAHGTSIAYKAGPWVNLPRPRNSYVWDDADTDFARADLFTKAKRWTQIVGSRAYCAHQGGGLSIADIAATNGPAEVARIAPGWLAYHVALSGNTAFVAAGTDGLIAVAVGGATPLQLSKTALGGNLRGCDVAGNTLVAAAMAGGVEVYDIGNPANPVRRAAIDGGSDWATCVKVVGNRAYVGAGKSLRVYDMTGAPVLVGQAAVGDWVLGVDVSGSTCVLATDGSGLAVFDVSAAAPVPKGNLKDALHLFSARLSGNLAFAACGSDGILIADISDPTNPKRLALTPTGSSSYDFTPPVAGSYSVVALGGSGVAPADLSDPKHPRLGNENYLTSTPPLGGDWDLGALRANLNNAANSTGKLKGDALFVHALLGAKTADPGLDFNNFDGFVVVIHGFPGRGQSSLYNSVTFEGQSVSFAEQKGIIWLPSHISPGVRTTWGRKAHEVGHWFVMPDIYTEWYEDGTVLVGDAADWDMAGSHDLGPLFSGHQADHMQVFDSSKIARRTWSPSTAPAPETFEIVAHGAAEDATGRINLLELKVSDSLSYFVEVRQKPGTVIFDAKIPIPAGAAGRVLVTRVDEAQSISNTFERPTMLFGVLNVGESVVDAVRLLRIEAAAVIQPDPLVYRVVVHWNEQPPPDPNGKFDLRIAPWSTDTWTTPDIWINSPRNDQGATLIYESHEPGDETKPTLNGDRPWVKHQNTIFARVSNSGVQDATDVFVSAYVTSPPGIGDNGSWETLKTVQVARIAANDSQLVRFDWTPAVDKHTCLSVAIFPQVGEISPDNNRAQENVAKFDSAGSSSHEPVVLEAAVRSPFSVWRRVDLRVRGLLTGWHAVVDKQWVWVEPKGSVPVTAVIWTDLDSPRAHEGVHIPPMAQPRVEGWTDFGAHRYLPIGGILAQVRANKQTRVVLEAAAVEGRIRVMAWLQPPVAGVSGVVEVTNAAGASRLVPFTTDAGGRIQAETVAAPGRYDVQVFTSSTPQAAEAESDRRQVIMPA